MSLAADKRERDFDPQRDSTRVQKRCREEEKRPGENAGRGEKRRRDHIWREVRDGSS